MAAAGDALTRMPDPAQDNSADLLSRGRPPLRRRPPSRAGRAGQHRGNLHDRPAHRVGAERALRRVPALGADGGGSCRSTSRATSRTVVEALRIMVAGGWPLGDPWLTCEEEF